jgi:hypothetical protein
VHNMRKNFSRWKNFQIDDDVLLFSERNGDDMWDRSRGKIISMFKKNRHQTKGQMYVVVKLQSDDMKSTENKLKKFHVKYPRWHRFYDTNFKNYIIWPLSSLHKVANS